VGRVGLEDGTPKRGCKAARGRGGASEDERNKKNKSTNHQRGEDAKQRSKSSLGAGHHSKVRGGTR